jgi:hypothetical protein
MARELYSNTRPVLVTKTIKFKALTVIAGVELRVVRKQRECKEEKKVWTQREILCWSRWKRWRIIIRVVSFSSRERVGQLGWREAVVW